MQHIERKHTEAVEVGSVCIGGMAPVSVQTMTKTDTADVEATSRQLRRLEGAGAELIRLAVPSMEAVQRLPEYMKLVKAPLIADIHFDHRLAIEAMRLGIPKIRINPGTLESAGKLHEVLLVAKQCGAAIRIGLNTGSLPKQFKNRTDLSTEELLAQSALHYCELFQDNDFHRIVCSVKATSVLTTIRANEFFAERSPIPLHVGLTEAGVGSEAIIRSSLAIGGLLLSGIGDTIRVSLTADPVEEVVTGWRILRELGLRKPGPRVISCPMCGRCTVNLTPLAEQAQGLVQGIDKPITVAIMGCEVNGPGEASHADIGIAFSRNKGLLFEKGVIVARGSAEDMMKELALRLTAFSSTMK